MPALGAGMGVANPIRELPRSHLQECAGSRGSISQGTISQGPKQYSGECMCLSQRWASGKGQVGGSGGGIVRRSWQMTVNAHGQSCTAPPLMLGLRDVKGGGKGGPQGPPGIGVRHRGRQPCAVEGVHGNKRGAAATSGDGHERHGDHSAIGEGELQAGCTGATRAGSSLRTNTMHTDTIIQHHTETARGELPTADDYLYSLGQERAVVHQSSPTALTA